MSAGADDIRHARFDTARVATLIPTLAHDDPIALFRRDALKRRAETFLRGFPGHVSYAVKANPAPDVLQTLATAGIHTFDVASVAEMRAVRAVLPSARLHYHNPVRSMSEINDAKALGVMSWSVDRMSELDKLHALPADTEIAVRLTLHRGGAAYDFGSKFGADPATCIALLADIARRGMTPSMTFHPGTQCTDAQAWTDYIAVCAHVAAEAGVTLASLNVGGGFPVRDASEGAGFAPIFKAIRSAVAQQFGPNAPTLWCEPGRAMVSDAQWLLLKVKARSGETVFLNDGLYGALGEWRDMPLPGQRTVFEACGQTRHSSPRKFTVFGPTCDSLDRVPGTWDLPGDIAEGDYILIRSAGAYTTALVTRFNGYGTQCRLNLS